MDNENPVDPLTRAANHIGSQVKLAEILGINSMTITQWRNRRIPAEWAVEVEKATDGMVRRHELRPDLWPAPTDAAA